MNKFCSKCGAEIKEGTKFCPKCGNSIQQVSVMPEPVVQEPVVQEPAVQKSKKKINKWIAIIMVVVVVVGVLVAVLYSGSSEESSENKQTIDHNDEDVQVYSDESTRTIMIYIVGSDLESNYGAASSDIDEMLDAGVDSDRNNVLIYTGGSSEWENSDISQRGNGIYLIEDDELIELENYSSKNMGKSSTLSSFLDYGIENYPADQYGLILWNHGAGPMLGYGVDEVYVDMLEWEEMADAIDDSAFGDEEELEFVGFDACLMGSVEMAWLFKDYANYFIASQEVEPGWGWNYAFLGELNECENGEDIGRLIVDSYFEYGEELFEKYPRYESELTLSCMNLGEIEKVEKCIDDLFEKVDSTILKGEIRVASQCRYQAKSFGKFTSDIDFDLVDLKHISSLLESDYKKEAKNLEKAIDEFVCYSKSNVDDANGISIYHPYDNMELASEWVKLYQTFDFASEYSNYIKNFNNTIKNDKGESNDIWKQFSKTAGVSQAKGNKRDLSIQLTKEQTETFSGASYLVFRKLSAEETFSGEEEYLHVFSGQDTSLDEKGTLTASYEGKAVFGVNDKTGEVSSFALSMNQVYDGSKEEKYYFPCMFAYLPDDMTLWEWEPVNWLMRIKDDKPVLLGAYSIDAEKNDMFPNRYLVDYTHYDVYTFANNSYKPIIDADGNLNFGFTGSSYGFEFTKEEGFHLEKKPISDKEEYYAVFLIEDIYGNSYYSDFFSLAK